jgi:Plasmid encoded RepA protein
LDHTKTRRVPKRDTPEPKSWESSGSVLRRTNPEWNVSKQRWRQVEGIALVRTKREEQKQSLAFSSRPFVLCGLPVRQPPKGQLLFERRNGRFLLQITGHPQYGLPFGQDRLVPIYLATLAVQQKSPTVRFRSGAEMLETFGLQKGGKEYRRLVAAFERIFGATIFFGTDTLSGKAKLVERSRFHFLREARIWYHRCPEQTVLSTEFENVIVLSDEFYQEITAHPIPTDLEAVKVLAGAPAVLDLFLWLSYRCFLAKEEEAIPLFGPFGLAQQLGSVEYSRPRRFRAKLGQWLDTIRTLWPECPVRLTPDVQSLLVGPGTAVHHERRVGA